MNNNINDIQKHREDILKDYQIKFTPTLKSVGALIFSGLISTFGIYSLIKGMVEADNLQIALSVFVLVLIVADTVKRSSLAKYYNSIIRKDIIKSGKILKVNLFIFFLALLFMVMFDFVGSYATATYAQSKYREFKTTDSKEFELLEEKATNAKSEVSLYKLELATYQKDKAEASVTCSEKWKGWKSKYKAKCKEDWEAKHPKPIKPNSNTTVSVKDYTELKESNNNDFLSRNIFNIVLFLSLALTMILQYTTVSEIKDNFDSIKETLTVLVLGILQDRLAELETNMIVHETKRNEVISQGDKREKEHKRDFEKLGKAIELMTFKKAVESREKTVLKISNNQNVMEHKKAGFVVNPFGDNETVKRSSKQPLNETEQREPLNGEHEKRGQKTQPLNESVITDRKETQPLNGVVKRIELKNYSHDDLELIDLLWKQSTVKRNDQLETRDNIIKIIGDNKNNTLRLRNLYKKLLKDDYIYKRVGYFAKVEL